VLCLDFADKLCHLRRQGLEKQVGMHGPQRHTNSVSVPSLDGSSEAVAPPRMRNDNKLSPASVVICGMCHEEVAYQSALLLEIGAQRLRFSDVSEAHAFCSFHQPPSWHGDT
jgi:hypothetical protein